MVIQIYNLNKINVNKIHFRFSLQLLLYLVVRVQGHVRGQSHVRGQGHVMPKMTTKDYKFSCSFKMSVYKVKQVPPGL